MSLKVLFKTLRFSIKRVNFLIQSIILIYTCLATIYSLYEFNCDYPSLGPVLSVKYLKNIGFLKFQRSEEIMLDPNLSEKTMKFASPDTIFKGNYKFYNLDCEENNWISNVSANLVFNFGKGILDLTKEVVANGTKSMDCQFTIFDRDCKMKIPINVSFIILYFSFFFVLSLLYLFFNFYLKKCESLFVKKLIYNFYYFLGIDPPVSALFCYKDGYTYKSDSPGKKILTMRSRYPGRMTPGDSRCTYKGFEYILYGGMLHRISPLGFCSSLKINLNIKQKTNLMDCFWYLNNLGYPCVVNTHCLNPDEILFMIESKTFFRPSKWTNLEYCNSDIDFTVAYSILGKKFPELLLSKLVTHNKKFFSETNGNFAALLRVSRGQAFFNHKPTSVKNSQWKMYTSDVNYLMNSEGFKINVSDIRKPTKCCNEVINQDDIEHSTRNTNYNVMVEKEIINGNEELTDGGEIKIELSPSSKYSESDKNVSVFELIKKREFKKVKEGDANYINEAVNKPVKNDIESLIRKTTKSAKLEKLKSLYNGLLKEFEGLIEGVFKDREEEQEAIDFYFKYGRQPFINSDLIKLKDSMIDFENEYEFDADDKLCEFSEFDNFGKMELFSGIINGTFKDFNKNIKELENRIKKYQPERLKVLSNKRIATLHVVMKDMDVFNNIANEKINAKEMISTADDIKSEVKDKNIDNTDNLINDGLLKTVNNYNLTIKEIMKSIAEPAEQKYNRDVGTSKKPVSNFKATSGDIKDVKGCIEYVKDKKMLNKIKGKDKEAEGVRKGHKKGKQVVLNKKNGGNDKNLIRPYFKIDKASFSIVNLESDVLASTALLINGVFLGKKKAFEKLRIETNRRVKKAILSHIKGMKEGKPLNLAKKERNNKGSTKTIRDLNMEKSNALTFFLKSLNELKSFEQMVSEFFKNDLLK